MSFKKSPTRLYKDPKHGKLMGVCAGIADYFDINITAVRFLTIIATIFFAGPLVVIAYIAMGLFLDPKPRNLYEDKEEEEFWKQTRKAPKYSAAELRRRFRDVERRTSDMEAYVTSKRFRLERELNALED